MESPKSTAAILTQLRDLMKNQVYVNHPLQAYVIPTSDAHQSEYIADRHKRREYVTKFTGSAGTAIITPKKALLWTDGRYFIQAEKELDLNFWTLMKGGLPDTPTQEEWLSKNLESGDYVGVDANLLNLDEWRRMSEALKKTGQNLVRVDPNLVDVVWQGEGLPDEPHSELIVWPERYSGKSWEDKVVDLQKELTSEGVYAVVVSALDDVAWLFNLRGADIPYNPVFMSYAIITTGNVSLFVNETRLTSKSVREHLHLDDPKDVRLQVFPYSGIHEELRALGKLEKKIWISSKDSCALSSFIPQDYLKGAISPVAVAKAVKNKVEIKGMQNAHIRDGAAVCEYLWWLENEIHSGNSVDEISGAKKLESLRKEQENFVSLSFEATSATGPNGAIIHYTPQADTARTIEKEDIYLIDSGGQYMDGTTDVTRTIHLGTPTSHQKECFTRVVKGHIGIAQCIFPNGTRGHILDILARKPLWEIGLDYSHGTGHGIGAFLNVHEGPIGISPRISEDSPFYAGMFLSDEPGYYEDDKFGIRVESILMTDRKSVV